MTGALAIFRISAAMRGNRIIYWLGRIPLIRRAGSDELYLHLAPPRASSP